MTQEEKELLLKDLCSRLSYGIIVHRISDNSTHRFVHSDVVENIDAFSHFLEYSGIDDIKPYLRPMSSMTEEERVQLRNYCSEQDKIVYDTGVSGSTNSANVIDWLNEHHFDFHNLIERGLAIDCTGLNVY